MGKSNRRFRNFFLLPYFQFKMGAYFIILSAVFFVGFNLIVNQGFEHLFQTLVISFRHDDTMLKEIYGELANAKSILFLLLSTYLATVIIFTAVLTHRIIGPIVAINKHTQELIKGNYKSRINLRKTDEFKDVSEELNKLASKLEASLQREDI